MDGTNQSMTDSERLAQILQGNLKGQLNTGDKLMALSALLRSVTRGRTQTPEQAFQAIQQQKAQEVQGRIQLAEMQKQSQQRALVQQYRQQMIDAETDPRRKAALQVANDETINKIIEQQFKPGPSDQYLSRLITLGQLRKENPPMAAAYEAILLPPTMTGSLETGIYPVPRNIPQFESDPDAIQELKNRGLWPYGN